MADFHIYVLTITTRIAVPADAVGDPVAVPLSGIPGAVRVALERQYEGIGGQPGIPVVALSAPTAVTV